MRKPLPLKKIICKLDQLYDLQEVLEREVFFSSSLCRLEDRILSLEDVIERVFGIVFKIRYGGYISATRYGVSFSEPCFVICDSPLKVFSELKSECIHRFPHAEGFINHSTSNFDEVVIYGVVEED